MPITAGELILQLVRSNAFDVNNSRSQASDSRPLQSQYRTHERLQLYGLFIADLLRGAFRDIWSGMSNTLPDERLVFVDLETAGGEPWRPIIQLAAIAVTSDLRELESYEAKLRFDEAYADPRSLKGSRYCRESWRRDAKPASAVLDDFAALLRRHATVDQGARSGAVYQVAQLVAHNAAYDAAFLDAWFTRCERFLPASPRVLCTMQRAIWLFHEDKRLTPPTDFRLQTLCEYFGVGLRPEDAHDALVDVRATIALYQSMRHAAV